MTFVKRVADGVFQRKVFGMPLGFKWVGAMAAALGLITDEATANTPEEHIRYRPGKRRQEGRAKPMRRNMLRHGQRVRRKHRRANHAD